MIIINSEIPIDPDKREEALQMCTNISETSRKEDGVIDHRVSIDAENLNLLRILEQYEDEKAVSSHMEAEYTQEFMEKLPDLLAGEIEATRFEVESATELEV